jgi:hypothetical protein
VAHLRKIHLPLVGRIAKVWIFQQVCSCFPSSKKKRSLKPIPRMQKTRFVPRLRAAQRMDVRCFPGSAMPS